MPLLFTLGSLYPITGAPLNTTVVIRKRHTVRDTIKYYILHNTNSGKNSRLINFVQTANTVNTRKGDFEGIFRHSFRLIEVCRVLVKALRPAIITVYEYTHNVYNKQGTDSKPIFFSVETHKYICIYNLIRWTSFVRYIFE